MSNSYEFSDNDIYFIYGYLYRMAEEAKQDGLFDGFSVKEVISIYLSEWTKKLSRKGIIQWAILKITH